jgi:type IV secretion system protein VirB5
MIITTYAMTAPGSLAYGALSDYQKANDPYQLSQQNTVEVAVNAVMQLSEETWRIEWTETRRQLSGKVLDSKIWQATATVSIIPPTEESQVLLNPVGVYVNNFSWAQRI